jgi:tRNA A37 methylthiotransferase MiaB
VADINPEMRVRFTSPHPKDFPEDVLDVIASYPNIARGIHMPIQSGSDRMLAIMRRNHTRDAYLDLISQFRKKVPDVEFSTDLITGFCGETEEDHLQTLSMLKEVEYEMAFMFAYSMRERTHAWHKVGKGVWEDDVTEPMKKRRLKEIVDSYREIAFEKSVRQDENQIKLVLVERKSKKSMRNEQNVDAGTAGIAAVERVQLTGRTDTFKRCVFGEECPSSEGGSDSINLVPGDYVAVRVDEAAVSTLQSTPLYRTTLAEFARRKKSEEPVEMAPKRGAEGDRISLKWK